MLVERVPEETGLTVEQVERVIQDIRITRSATTSPLHEAGLLMELVP